MTIRLLGQLLLASEEPRRVTLSDVEDKLRSLGGSTESLVKDAAPLLSARSWPAAWPRWLRCTCSAAVGDGGGHRCSRYAGCEKRRPGLGERCVATLIAGPAS